MNLDDLKKIDINTLKNIDTAQLKAMLLSRIDILINIFLIGITIFATIYIYNNKKINYNKANAELEQVKQKKDAIKALISHEEIFEKAQESVLKNLSGDLLISKLSEYAVLHNVQIKTFSPAQETVGKYSSVANVKINISAKDFKGLLMFANQIEQSDYFLRIKSWSAQMESRSSGFRRQVNYEEDNASQQKTIDATLEIESLSLK